MCASRFMRADGGSPAHLGPALRSLLTRLYQGWYSLPAKSTRRHVKTWLETLHPLVSADVTQPVAVQELHRFVDDLANMTGVEDVAGEALTRLRTALKGKNTALTTDEKQALSEMLAASDPASYAVQQMFYNPSTVRELYEGVYQTLSNVAPNLEPQLQTQLSTVWQAHAAALQASAPTFEARTAVYEDALKKLEQIPKVVQLAHHYFVVHKVNHPSEIKTYRSIGRKPEGERAVKSPFESMSGGTPKSADRALELDSEVSMSPFENEPLAAAADADDAAVDDATIEDRSEGDATPGGTRSFFPDIRFPEKVQVREEVPLIIQFALEQREESRVPSTQFGIEFPDLKEPEYVEVVLNAPGFDERSSQSGEWSRTMMVYADRASQPAVFLLRAREEGEQLLTVSFYHRGRHLGQAKIHTSIGSGPTVFGTTPSKTQTEVMVQAGSVMAADTVAVPPADLELRITQGSDKSQLSFMLHSSKARVGYHWRPVGEVTLAQADPQKYLEYKFERMSHLAGELHKDSSAEDVRRSMREIETIGEELFEDLFPDKLKDEYWKRIKPLREKGIVKSFLVTSDEPWIPWEMVKPYRYDDVEDVEESDGFLCEAFQFCRWLAGNSPAEEINIRKVTTVVPRLDLVFAAKEQDYFSALDPAEGVDVDGPLKSRDEVLDSSRSGGFDIFHFAAHGQFLAQQVNRSPLVLENSEELLPDDLVGRQLRGLRRSKPIVFLNACHTSRINFALTGLGGWAEKMVQDAGASAFIGTLWEVDDELALAFSTQFYEQLRQNQPLGLAFSSARKHVRELAPANPTWLAYTLYGDPNSRVRWGG